MKITVHAWDTMDLMEVSVLVADETTGEPYLSDKYYMQNAPWAAEPRDIAEAVFRHLAQRYTTQPRHGSDSLPDVGARE